MYRRFLTQPMAVLRDKAVEIAGSREHLGEAIPRPAVRELRELADAFNDMSAKLRTSMDRIEERVAERTRELHTANELLRKKVREHAEAEAEVSRLFAIMHRESEEEEERLRAGAEEERTRVGEQAAGLIPRAVHHIRSKIYGETDVLPGHDE